MGEFAVPVLREETMSNGFTIPILGGERRRQVLNEVLKFKMRPDDVIVATYPKAGTTWLQEIVWLICNNADTALARKVKLTDRYDWVEGGEYRPTEGFKKLDSRPMERTRFIKTHLPFQLLPTELQNEAIGKLIYVARNPKDNCVSFYHFLRMHKALPDPGTLNEFMERFYRGNVLRGSWFDHVEKYWQISQERRSNMHIVLYENMQRNCKEEIKTLVKFLEKDLSETQIDIIANHCAFDNMKDNNSVNFSDFVAAGIFDDSVSKFMRKGQVGDWKNHFTASQNQEFDDVLRKKTKDWTLKFDYE